MLALVALAHSDDPTATDRILAAAREVFARDGLEASLGDVATHAGVGVGSIYRRFESKDDLIQELADQRFSTIIARMTAALDSPDPWDAFSAEFRRSVAEYTTDRGFRELVISGATGTLGWSRGREPEGLARAMQKWSTEIEAVIARLIGRAQDAGELRADVTGSVILQLSIALQSISGLVRSSDHEKAIDIVLDGLRAR
jgi:AcrR family transcriptional regulator